MQDFTNLAWPETPFGADQRPFGRRAHMLAAFDIGWGWYLDGAELPACVSVIYLRVDPARPLVVEPATLPVGFRATVVEARADLESLLDVLDRALVRARRHAYLLAGHRLDDSLTRLDLLSSALRPGITSVLDAWEGRDTKVRGMARLRDTADDRSAEPVDVGLGTAPAVVPMQTTATATGRLARCLAIALTAGRRSGRLRWKGTFTTREALAAAGWDILDAPTKATAG